MFVPVDPGRDLRVRAALAGPYRRSSARALEPGDTAVLELGTCVDGYWSDLTRTAVAGEPSAEQAAIAAIRAGVSCETVDRAARGVLEVRGHGTGFTHGTGHQVGFRYHDAGPRLEPGSTTLLEEDRVVTVEPGAYGSAFGGGARFEDNIYVDDVGAEVLSA